MRVQAYSQAQQRTLLDAMREMREAGGPPLWTPAADSPLFWIDPSQAGTLTLAGSAISAIADASGSGRSMVPLAGGVPTLDTTRNVAGCPAILLGTSKSLECASGGVTGATPCAIHVLADWDISAETQPAGLARFGPETATSEANMMVGVLTNPGWNGNGPDFLPYTLGGGTFSSPPYSPHAYPADVAWEAQRHMISTIYTGTKRKVCIDGREHSSGNATQTITQAIASAVFGIGRSDSAHQSNRSAIRQVVFEGSGWSVATRARLVRYWTRRGLLSALPPNVVFEGDSITYGTGAVAGTSDWPTLAMAAVAGTYATATRVNNGLSGKTAATMNTETTTTLAPRYSGRRCEVFVGLGGTNDFIALGVSAATCIASIQAMLAAAKTVFDRVVVCTIIGGSSAGGYWDSTNEPKRQTVNAWIRSSVAAGYADALIDFDANAGLVWPTDYASGTDQLHPSAAGYAKMAAVAAPVIVAAIAAGARTP